MTPLELRRLRNIFLVVFCGSAAFIAADERVRYATSWQSEAGDISAYETPVMSAKDILGSRKQTYGQAALADSASILPLIIATISSATSLIGAIGATVIAWRRENRESKRQEHDIEKIRLDIEKLRGELEKKEAAQRRKVKRLS